MPERYLSRRQCTNAFWSLIFVRPTIHISGWLTWLPKTLTKAQKKEFFVSTETDSSERSSEDDTMTEHSIKK